MKPSNQCPDCGERLSAEAERCGSCGWVKPGVRKRHDAGPRHNMVCTWHSGSLFCRWPVGQFLEGATSGFCAFHREEPEGVAAADLARESEGATSADYLARVKARWYGGADNANVRRLREQLVKRASGGNVGLFSTRILGPEPSPQSEPGENG